MAFAFSSTAIHGGSLSKHTKGSQIGCFPTWDGAHRPPLAVGFSGQNSAVRPWKVEAKRNESVVASAAAVVAPDNAEKVEAEDNEKLAKQLKFFPS